MASKLPEIFRLSYGTTLFMRDNVLCDHEAMQPENHVDSQVASSFAHMLLVLPRSQNKPPDFVDERVLAGITALHNVHGFTDLHFAHLHAFCRMIARTRHLFARSCWSRRRNGREARVTVIHIRSSSPY